LELALDSSRPPDDVSDATGRGRIAAVRNRLVARFLLPRHRYVLWLDADLTVVPDDLASRLHAACAYDHGAARGPEDARVLPAAPGRAWGCVAAPLVLLDTAAAVGRAASGGAAATHAEGLASRRDSALRFYDTAAFVQAGEAVQVTSPPGMATCKHRNYGSVHALPPYFNFSTSQMHAAAAAEGAHLAAAAAHDTLRRDAAQNQ
jgi:hypothetical protein